MHRIQQFDLQCRDIWPTDANLEGQDNSLKLLTGQHQKTKPVMPPNPMVNRLSFLPAYPTFDRFGPINRDHLLLANIPRLQLTIEQRRRRDHHSFHQPFTLIDQSSDINSQPFFVYVYQHLYANLGQRFHIDNAILDYNYERLRQCINILTQECIRYGLYPENTVGSEQLRIDEYALALEFYLQIDADLFFMKTCSFRHAQPTLYNHHGIFCIDPPQAHYGMTPCGNVSCRFCFPITDISTRARQNQPVIRFSAAQKHRLVNGYEVILNCPISCTTKNILYALTCPCGQFDYIGYTRTSLSERLAYHREHGNRMIHENILGPENSHRMRQHQPKTKEEWSADEMLLYKHVARCSSAIQLFLDCNPQYWCFVPMLKIEAIQTQNLHSDPVPLFASHLQTRRDQEMASVFINDLPSMPSENYTFSAHQRQKQLQTFKDQRDQLIYNLNLDLCEATILAVLPDHCSDLFYCIIEALFITHGQTKLNTLGHLDGMIVDNNNMNHMKTPRTAHLGEWCHNLLRRPATMLHEARTINSHRNNPHFQ